MSVGWNVKWCPVYGVKNINPLCTQKTVPLDFEDE